MTFKNLQLIARVLIALIFFVAGVRKLLTFAATAAYFSKLGLPAPEVVAALVALIEVGGSIALVVGWRLREVAVGMGVFTLVTAVIGHPFWSVEPEQFSGQLNNCMKNVAITGAFLLLALQGEKSKQQV